MLYIDDLCFSYCGRYIFNGASFFLKKGRVASILGSSGIGKTTLFKLIAGLLNPHSGSIEISNESRSSRNLLESVSYMKQEALLLPWRTVWENMLLFTELGGGHRENPLPEDITHRATTLLQKLNIQNIRDCYPEELSGGMKQRVSLAASLLQKKPLLLLDEPFSFLDLVLKERLYDYIHQEVRNHETSILLITHDFRDALTLSDDIFIIQNQKIEKVGSDCSSLSTSERDNLVKEIKFRMTISEL